jgi:hypothetical protein
MPSFRKLTVDEVAAFAVERGRKSMDLTEYKAFLADVPHDEWCAIDLSAEENTKTVKRYLKAACAELGHDVEYMRSPSIDNGDGTKSFRVIFKTVTPTPPTEGTESAK